MDSAIAEECSGDEDKDTGEVGEGECDGDQYETGGKSDCFIGDFGDEEEHETREKGKEKIGECESEEEGDAEDYI